MTKTISKGCKLPPVKAKSGVKYTKPKEKVTGNVQRESRCHDSDPDPDGDGDGGVYKIDKFLAYRTIIKYEYLIQWECSDCPNSWISEDDFVSKGARKEAEQFRRSVEKHGAYAVPEHVDSCD